MIDLGRLKELRDEIGAEDFAEVAEIFLEEMADMLHQLMANPSVVRPSDFHFLRGSAVNMGFHTFGQLAFRAEQAVTDGNVPDIGGLSRAFDEARAKLAEVHPELGLQAA